MITNVDIDSDRRMVRAKVWIDKNKLARFKIIKTQKRSKVDILRLKERKTAFQLELKNRFESLDTENADLDTKVMFTLEIVWPTSWIDGLVWTEK